MPILPGFPSMSLSRKWQKSSLVARASCPCSSVARPSWPCSLVARASCPRIAGKMPATRKGETPSPRRISTTPCPTIFSRLLRAILSNAALSTSIRKYKSSEGRISRDRKGPPTPTLSFPRRRESRHLHEGTDRRLRRFALSKSRSATAALLLFWLSPLSFRPIQGAAEDSCIFDGATKALIIDC
jgi:hypothetical protein